MIRTWYLELYRRNRMLAFSGLVYLFITLVLAILPFFDSRELLGVSIWNKPLKFFISTTVLFWTVGWIMVDIQNKIAVSFISRGVFLLLSAELISISYQIIQDKTSNFNISNPLNGEILGAIDVLIFLNSLFFVYILI